MTKQQTITVYRFSELDSGAKERAKSDYDSVIGYHHADEAIETLKALAFYFGGGMQNWSIDFGEPCRSTVYFDMPDMEAEEISRRLDALGAFNPVNGRGDGDCTLTGVFTDEEAIDGFRKEFLFNGERDLEMLMHCAFNSLLEACKSDYREQYSDEVFGEHCDINDYWFLADGKMA